MAGLTLAQAESQLATWLAAMEAVASGQSYSISGPNGSRALTKADLGEIRQTVDYWQGWCTRLSDEGVRVTLVTPV